MMKSNPVGTLLGIALGVVSVVTALLFLSYVQSARRLQPLQTELMIINRNQAALQNLVSEAVEYIKRDPSIEPVLQSAGIQPKTAAPARTPKPPGK